MTRVALGLVALLGCAEPLDAFESDLAVVIVDTSGREMGRKVSVWDDSWVDATYRVYGAAEGSASTRDAPEYDGLGAIHVRGNSSREYDKVSFRVELRDAEGDDLAHSLLGLPAAADWILQAPYSDKTLTRNALIYSLSRDVDRYAPRTRPVELFVVDNRRKWSMAHYRGVYQLTERVEGHPERVPIQPLLRGDLSEPEISGGYLLKRDWIEPDEDGYFKTPVVGDALTLKEPDPTPKDQEAWLKDWFGDFETALMGPDFADPVAGYAAHVDVDSFVDHMLLVELGRNVDGYVLSTWMSKDREGPLTMGPIWDYNGALGNADYFQAWEVEGWHYENPSFPEDNKRGFDWYARMLEDPAFRARIGERWSEHRSGVWSDAALEARIDDLVAELGTEAVDRNFERWPVLGEYVWPNDEGSENRASHREEVDYLRSWLLDRAAWLDQATLDLTP